MSVVFLVMLMTIVSADYVNLCLTRGEGVEFSKCNPRMEDRYCSADTCNYCAYIGSKGFYCPANPNQCNAIGSSCTYVGDGGDGGGGNIDRTPPKIGTCTPRSDSTYASRNQIFRGNVDKKSDWFYKNSNDKKPRWKKLCKETTRCEKRIRFNEGPNNFLIKAVAQNGASDEKEMNFKIDSKKPKIKKTYPKKGFASGTFEIDFTESNPESLVLHYAGETQEVDIKNDCRPGTQRKTMSLSKANGKTYCSVDVDVSEFDKKRISYWFSLVDSAGITVNSKKIYLSVDTSYPVINNHPFYEVSGKYVYFDISITEPNLDEVSYSYLYKGRYKTKKLCTKLKNGKCEKRVSFKKCHHYVLDVAVSDEAGHAVGERIEFGV